MSDPVSKTPNIELPEADAAAVIAAARAGEPDRYLAALLAPPPHRQALLALAAFSAEIRRIPLLAHEPAMAEIRAQWWRDALTLPAQLRAGHPVADAVRAAAHTYHLPVELLEGVIDALTTDAGGEPSGAEDWLRAHLWKTEGALFALAAQTVGRLPSAEATAACTASGHAYGLTRLLLELPAALERGHSPSLAALLATLGLQGGNLPAQGAEANIELPLREHVAQIRRSVASARLFVTALPRSKRTAFLPLALVGPYLRALERSGARFWRQSVNVAPLTRVCRIATAHLFGRV